MVPETDNLVWGEVLKKRNTREKRLTPNLVQHERILRMRQLTANYLFSGCFLLWSLQTVWEKCLVDELPHCFLTSPSRPEHAIPPSIHWGARGLRFIHFRVFWPLVSDFMSLSFCTFSEPPSPDLDSLSLSLGPPRYTAITELMRKELWNHQVGWLSLQIEYEFWKPDVFLAHLSA